MLYVHIFGSHHHHHHHHRSHQDDNVQRCALQLDIDFIDGQQAMDVSDFTPNNEWTIVGNWGVKNVKYYSCCPEPYPDITFTLRIRRKVAFYTFILILPCGLLSLLNMVIFWVPPESPAKLQIGQCFHSAHPPLLPYGLTGAAPCVPVSLYTIHRQAVPLRSLPAPYCIRPIVYQTHCQPDPLSIRSIVYQTHCHPGPLSVRLFVYKAHCVPGPGSGLALGCSQLHNETGEQ